MLARGARTGGGWRRQGFSTAMTCSGERGSATMSGRRRWVLSASHSKGVQASADTSTASAPSADLSSLTSAGSGVTLQRYDAGGCPDQ